MMRYFLPILNTFFVQFCMILFFVQLLWYFFINDFVARARTNPIIYFSFILIFFSHNEIF